MVRPIAHRPLIVHRSSPIAHRSSPIAHRLSPHSVAYFPHQVISPILLLPQLCGFINNLIYEKQFNLSIAPSHLGPFFLQ
jgi:hypothetical protein